MFSDMPGLPLLFDIVETRDEAIALFGPSLPHQNRMWQRWFRSLCGSAKISL